MQREESFKENEGLPPPPIVDHENDEYYIKFNELILEFDKNMENMTPDDIITFPIKENSEEVTKYIIFPWKVVLKIIMEEIHNVSTTHPSVLRGLYFMVTPEETDVAFKVFFLINDFLPNMNRF